MIGYHAKSVDRDSVFGSQYRQKEDEQIADHVFGPK
jgi:hypothetical protein